MPIPRLAPALLASLLACAGAQAADKEPVNAGPYVPSPTSVVSDMLTLAKVDAKDFVIDLGSGDGRIVLTAAKVFGARGFGVDINEKLVKEANEAAKIQGIADRASFMVQDLFKTDIRKATVVTMYLLPNTVNMLKDKLLTELAPGTRILSHDYPLSGWIPETYRQFDLQDKVAISGVTTTLIYLYVVPARAQGRWTAKLPPQLAKELTSLELRQAVTRVSGEFRLGGKDVPIHDARMRGDQISFKLAAADRVWNFTGTVKGPSIEGIAQADDVKAPWSATPVK